MVVFAAWCLFFLPLSALAQTYQVVQIWNDQDDLDGLRPSAAPVTVQGPGGEYTVLDSTPLDLPDGEYTFSQAPLPEGYTVEGPYFDDHGAYTTVIFINSHRLGGWVMQVSNILVDPEPPTADTTDFTVYKEWRGTAQNSITLHLFADGKLMPQAKFEREGNAYTVRSLPAYGADGHKIVYSATEYYMAGYMTMYLNVGIYEGRSRAVYNGGTIVNRETTTFAIKKQWMGVSASDRPAITFQLYQNGEPILWRQPEPDADGWYVWKNLPKMKGEEVAVYSAAEIPLQGFQARYVNPDRASESANQCYNGGTIINYKVPQTGDSAPLGLYAAMIGTGLVGLLLLIRSGKRAKKHE